MISLGGKRKRMWYEGFETENELIRDNLIHDNKDSANLSLNYPFWDKLGKKIIHISALTRNQPTIQNFLEALKKHLSILKIKK